MPELEDASPTREPQDVSPPKKKRKGCCGCAFVFLLILVPLGLILLNGPGFRFLARFAGLKVAATQGLEGNFLVDGSLWSGFQLHEIDLSDGTEKGISIRVDKLSLAYRPLDLIRSLKTMGWLNEIHIGPGLVHITLPDSSEKRERPPRAKPTSAGDPLAQFDSGPIWNLLATRLRIEDLTLFLHQGDRVTSIESLNLSLPPHDEGVLSFTRLSLPGQAPLENVHATITREERHFTIESLPLLGYANLDSLTLSESESAGLNLNATLSAMGGKVSLTSEIGGGNPLSLNLSLNRGSSLDLALLPLPHLDLSPLHGLVSDLKLTYSGDIARPSTWQVDGKLVASNTGWDKFGADSVMFLIQDNRLEAEAARGRTTLRITANTGLDHVRTLSELPSLSTQLALKLDLPNLADTLADFELNLPLAGSLQAEARDVQVTAGKVSSGSFLMLSDALAWDGIALSEGQIAAHVEQTNLVRFAVDLGLDDSSDAHLGGVVNLEATGYEADATIQLDTSGRLGKILTDLGIDTFSGASSLAWKGNGALGSSGHHGNAKLLLRSFTLGTGQAIDGSLELDYEDKSASLALLATRSDGVTLRGNGTWDGSIITLPDWTLTNATRVPLTLSLTLPFEPGYEGGFLAQTAPLLLDLNMSDLATEEITQFFTATPPLQGTLDGTLIGRGSLAALALDGKLGFRPALESAAEQASPLATAELSFKGDVDQPSTWDLGLDAELTGLQWNELALENITLSATTDTEQAGRPFIALVRFDQSATLLKASARIDLASLHTLKDFAQVPLRADASLEVTEIATLLRDFSPSTLEALPLTGSLSAALDGFQIRGGSLTAGTIQLQSSTVHIADEKVEAIQIDATVPAPDEIDATLKIALDSLNHLDGNVGLHLKDLTYQGKLALNLDRLAKGSRLRSLLEGHTATTIIPENAKLTWSGDGQIRETSHAGSVSLSATGLRLAAGAEALSATIVGQYSEDSADFPTLKLESTPLNFDGVLAWTEHRLTLSGKGNSVGRETISLEASLPLDPKVLQPASWFAQETPLSLDLKVDHLPLAQLSRLFLETPPLEADLTLSFSATGTPAEPSLQADLALSELTVPREDEALPVGQLHLTLASSEATLNATGEYTHPDVRPLQIAATLPFDPGAWTRGDREIGEEEISASARMEESSLAFLRSQVPGIESIAGQVSLDVTVAGTIAAPQIQGDGKLGIERLRLENRLAPSLRDIDLVATFGDNRIVLERLSAVVAGGTLEGQGEAVLQAGEEPQLRLSLTGHEVLVVRTNDVNVRTDLNLTLEGPWSSASLSGELGITNSRYFRNFDLLPIGLPTRRATTALPTVERSPRGGGVAYQDLNFGVPIAPFENWPVSIRVHTKDPFLIRSNLLESAITSDLMITGTLGHPNPTGQVSIDEGEMKLPFSKIDVETGRIEFDAATGFNGAIEFKAKGKADRYDIAIYLYDRVLSPQYVLTSIPPLPSEDIITLLATGTTRSDLIGEDAGSLAAGKAAGLLLKNLRKKNNEIDSDPTLLDLLEERTELELGRINRETGEQTFGGKIRLWKQLFFVGDVDSESDYRALLKYVFRFK